jgi:FAD/FMN-containing dehydrogenase
MKLRSTDDQLLEITEDTLQKLRSRVRGTILTADSPGYEESRTVWNGMIQRRPGLVVRCLGVGDVVACVDFARENGVLLSIKGGGHNIAGLAVCDGGIALDLAPMRGVWVDPAARLARAQGGCLLGDVDRETQLHGLAAVLGFVSNTGIAGLTLGGGFGYLSRRFGWTSDNVAGMEVVTAEGRIVRASETENADLFWGLCGGGGNFGVVTAIDYRLFPVGPEIVGGAVAWRAEEAPGVLQLFRKLYEEGPPELSLAIAMRPSPPAPWIAKEVHGQPIIILVVCHSGSIADGERAVAPIREFGSPVGNVLMKRSYASQQSLLDATQPKGRRYYWKSEYLPKLGDELFELSQAHARRIESPHSAVLFFPLAGVLTRHPNDHSAVGNRDAAIVLNIAASWERAEEDAKHVEWARAAWREMRKFSTGGTYINFLNEEEGGERIQAAFGDNLGRLAEVKGRWDPTNLFRVNKNVAPGAVRA